MKSVIIEVDHVDMTGTTVASQGQRNIDVSLIEGVHDVMFVCVTLQHSSVHRRTVAPDHEASDRSCSEVAAQSPARGTEGLMVDREEGERAGCCAQVGDPLLVADLSANLRELLIGELVGVVVQSLQIHLI